MALALATKNLRVSSPEGIENHNTRHRKNKGTNLKGIDFERTKLNLTSKMDWDKFDSLRDRYKSQIKATNERYKSKSRYEKIKSYNERLIGKDGTRKSLVSDWEISLNPDDFPNGIPKDIWPAIIGILNRLCPEQMKRAIQTSVHFDEFIEIDGKKIWTQPHMSIPFSNFIDDEITGKVRLDSAYYSKDSSRKSRMRKGQIAELANNLTRELNKKYDLDIPLNENKRSTSQHFDPEVFKFAVQLPSELIVNRELKKQVETFRSKHNLKDPELDTSNKEKEIERYNSSTDYETTLFLGNEKVATKSFELTDDEKREIHEEALMEFPEVEDWEKEREAKREKERKAKKEKGFTR